MARPLTNAERQLLMESPDLVMFTPRRRGLKPVVFLLVIPVATAAVLASVLYLTGLLSVAVETAPVLSSLVFVAACVLMPFACLRAKTWYDNAYGCDRELRGYLAREDLVVEVARITGSVVQRAEVYAETEDGPFLFGIAGTLNTFVPKAGDKVALLKAQDIALAVRSDPKTSSLLAKGV